MTRTLTLPEAFTSWPEVLTNPGREPHVLVQARLLEPGVGMTMKATEIFKRYFTKPLFNSRVPDVGIGGVIGYTSRGGDHRRLMRDEYGWVGHGRHWTSGDISNDADEFGVNVILYGIGG
jgi:hypothetical protein